MVHDWIERSGIAALRARLRRAPPGVQAILWAVASGMLFSILNAIQRALTLQLPPFEVQFLRYMFGAIVMLPLIVRHGLRAYRPNGLAGQLWRGAVHTLGLMMWFVALPHLSLADSVAIAFTTPLFVMFGAALVFHERIVRERWIASAIGFGGVLLVLWPHLGGGSAGYALLMLLSSPMFAISFLITKALTRRDAATVIVVWQALTITLFSMPFALMQWTAPTFGQWIWFMVCGLVGSIGHYFLTRSFAAADISASQSVRFLDLVWASVLGILVFGDIPSSATLIGGLVILATTLWIARHEARSR